MKVLQTPEQAVLWLKEQISTGQLSVDSRMVKAGDGFIAWPGAAVDGRQFVAGLLKQNVAACIVEQDGVQAWSWVNDARVAVYAGLKKDIARIAALYYEQPSRQMDVFAVTGTNGKTSTSWWIAQALSALNHACGVVGTMGIGTLDQLEPSALTTPDPVRLSAALRNMVEHSVKACAIEASSIGIEEHRFDGLNVKVALFTNITQDHLDYHETMEAYWQAKRRLFSWPRLKAAVINIDDEYGAKLAQELIQKNGALQVITYTRQDQSKATLKACHIQHLAEGLVFDVCEGQLTATVQAQLVGDYNISNVLGVIGALRASGYGLSEAAKVCSTLLPVPGRMQNVVTLKAGQCKVVVDYAHTPDALENVLKALQPLAKARHGELWCVFGCGGDRDARKRPLMGKIAQELADKVVVTSDNPRTETPEKILQDIVAGMKQDQHLQVEVDRKKAIEYALKNASNHDVVLIAGKGHEPYQEISGVRYPFSDADIGSQFLNRSGSGVLGMLTLQQASDLMLSQGVRARIIGDAQTVFSRVHTDTRTLVIGDLFVALRGEKFDAHDFLVQAKSQGAVAALAEHGLSQAGLCGLEVSDSLKALGALAKGWRVCHKLPVIAVTGSNGKTTTTQMIASILNAWHAENALATQGNLNNEIGVPLSVLRLRPHHQVAVFELGMNHPGEIAALAKIAKPTVALVNNAQREHLEFMQTVEAVAKENGQVIEALGLDGVAVYPANDAFSGLWKEMAQVRNTVMFALDQQADANYFADYEWLGDAWKIAVTTPCGTFECVLRCAGEHNVKNALAAIACAQQAGAPIEALAQGIDSFKAVSGRSEVTRLSIGDKTITLINDSYNANPDSVRAAIDVLAGLSGNTLLVLGEMGEVGVDGQVFHTEVGMYAKEKGIQVLWGTGALVKNAVEAFGHKGRFFESMDELGHALMNELEQYSSILVKGSRYTRMERAIDYIKAVVEKKGGEDVA